MPQDERQSQPTGGVGLDAPQPEAVVRIAFEWASLKKIETERFRQAFTAAKLGGGERMTEAEFDKAMEAGGQGEKVEKPSGKAGNPEPDERESRNLGRRR